MKIGSLLAVGFATALLSGTASASITSYEGVDDGAPVGGTFTNSNAASAAFAAAAGPLETIDFESVPTGHQPSYVLPGVTISVTGPVYGYPFSGVIAGTVGNVYGFDIGTGRGNWLGFPDGTATFTFDNPVTAFGFYTTGLQTTFGLSFDVTFNDGTAQSLSPTVLVNGGASFFGFTNTNAFSSVTIARPGSDAWGIDNVSFSAPAVPEPATWAMMIGGFALVGSAMRRRRPAVSFA